ncbi:MAG: AAA family ATPase [bacterium]|nr:AAA family ATPase [bacterium]
MFAFSGIQHRDPKTKKEMLRSFSLEQDLPDLDAALHENPDTRLVVIDPVAAYLGKVDSHKNADVRGLLAPLADLAGKHRVAVVTVTHLSKSGGSKAVYRAMGSLAFAAASRAVWAIVKDQDDPNRRLFLPAKLNLARDPDGLAYAIEGGRVVWDTNAVSLHADDAFAQESRDQQRGKPKSTERNEAADYLRQELADGPKPASDVIELGEQYGFTKRTLQRAFTSINGERKKESFEGPWIWQLKPEGDMFHQRDT